MIWLILQGRILLLYILNAYFFSLCVQIFYLYIIESKSVPYKYHFITKNNLIIILWWRLKLPSFAIYCRDWEMFNFVKLVSMKIHIILFHTFFSHLLYVSIFLLLFLIMNIIYVHICMCCQCDLHFLHWQCSLFWISCMCW